MKNYIPLVLLVVVLLAVAYAITALSPKRDTAADLPGAPEEGAPLSISSPAFASGTRIPHEYTCDAAEPVSPELSFANVPAGTESLVMVMDDPDVPTQVRPEGYFDHWVLFNIPAGTSGIERGGSAGTSGANGQRSLGYAAPCPPREFQPTEHRYQFDLYALNATLDLPEGATKEQVLAAAKDHVIARSTLVGTYERVVK